MNLQETMNPSVDDAIKYYRSMIFPQDMSTHTLRAVAMNKLAIKALQEKAARAEPENKPLTVKREDCSTCQFIDVDRDKEPFRHCKCNFLSKYVRKPGESETTYHTLKAEEMSLMFSGLNIRISVHCPPKED